MKVIGMISGTSFDAIEAVAMDLSLDDHVVSAQLLESSLGALHA